MQISQVISIITLKIGKSYLLTAKYIGSTIDVRTGGGGSSPPPPRKKKMGQEYPPLPLSCLKRGFQAREKTKKEELEKERRKEKKGKGEKKKRNQKGKRRKQKFKNFAH